MTTQQSAATSEAGQKGVQGSAATPTATGTPSDHTRERATSQLQVEAAKILLSSYLEFIRSTTQVLQAFTSLLLTAYVALLVNFGKENAFHNRMSFAVALLPIGLWAASLAAGYIIAVTYKGKKLRFDKKLNPTNALETYEEVAKERRNQLKWPSVLTLAGIVAFVVSLFVVFFPSISEPAIQEGLTIFLPIIIRPVK